jgi:hypothetical protein
MMLNPQIAAPSERARVSILERLAPSFSFSLATIAGAVGAAYIQWVFRALRMAENAGFAAVYGGLAEAHSVVTVILVLAAVIGVLGIIVAAARMFTTNRTASPPGFLFLVPAGISVLSPLIMGYAASLAVSTLKDPQGSGISGVAGTIEVLNWTAIGATLFALLILVVFTFVPFRSRTGRKFTPVIFCFSSREESLPWRSPSSWSSECAWLSLRCIESRGPNFLSRIRIPHRRVSDFSRPREPRLVLRSHHSQVFPCGFGF